MTAITPVDVAVNPNNVAQRYILWTNGRIDAIGGAPAITSSTTWYDRFDPPGVAIYISNWSTGAGYTLDYRGFFNPINGATAVGGGSTPNQMSGITPTADPRRKLYVDWAWDPSGSGQGYVLDLYGRLWPFGGASVPPRAGTRWGSPLAKKFQMRWTPDKRAITVDRYGKLYGDFSAVVGTLDSSYGTPTFDAARDLAVLDWDAGSGYILNLYGNMVQFGGRPRPYGWPYRPGTDAARCLAILSPDNPEQYWEVWGGGQSYDFVNSTPPTVTAGGVSPVSPASTVTDSTRPDLRWEYSDPQGDEQQTWQLLVFTQTFVSGHTMTDPLAWVGSGLVNSTGIDRTVRGVTSPVDFVNGTYRMYVRGQDTSGQWSAWSNYGWTQNVPAPPTPTSLTATPNQAAFSVALSVSTSTGSADTVRFERSDDGGVTWAPVRGLEAIPRSTTTTGTDYDPPLGITRTYRAVTYAINPRVLSAPSNTVTATITTRVHALTAVDDSTLGGEVDAVDPAEWTRPVVAGVFQGLGADFPTVLKDGKPKARRLTLHVQTHDSAAWLRVKALVESGSMLVHRDPFGEVVYCELTGDWSRGQVAAAPLLTESTPLRHFHRMDLPLVEVAPPILVT